MSEPPRYPGAPGWVRTLGIGGLVLALLVAVALLAGHGAGRHFGTADPEPRAAREVGP